jgi:hypothetical protein
MRYHVEVVEAWLTLVGRGRCDKFRGKRTCAGAKVDSHSFPLFYDRTTQITHTTTITALGHSFSFLANSAFLIIFSSPFSDLGQLVTRNTPTYVPVTDSYSTRVGMRHAHPYAPIP